MNRFAVLTQLLDDQLERLHLHSAAQVVVRQDGQVVFEYAAGDGPAGPILADTPFLTFSITKAFTGICIHRLIEEGRIELDAPIARYWPEFGCNGKESATIRHVFLHQAGIPAPGLRRQVFLWPYWGGVTRSIASLKAVYPPGTRTAYHIVNYGFIFGEVIRRVTGLPVDAYLHQTFFKPMSLNHSWLRIPRHELRRSPRVFPKHPVVRNAAFIFNLPAIRRALLPAASLHSTASDLAAFFQMLLDGGQSNGRRFLKPETIAAAARSGNDGWDAYIKAHMNWGYGFIIGGGSGQTSDTGQWIMGKGSSSRTFGAFGMGTSMVWADPDARLVAAFTCNGMLANQQAAGRWATISNAVWDAASA